MYDWVFFNRGYDIPNWELGIFPFSCLIWTGWVLHGETEGSGAPDAGDEIVLADGAVLMPVH